MKARIWVTFDTLEEVEVPLEWKAGSYGSLLEFRGCVRNSNEGKSVEGIEYEAHLPLAEISLKNIRETLLQEFPDISDAVIYHRIGKLGLGEVSLFVGVASAHRKNAFAFCERVIAEIKKSTPIWKRELYAHEKHEWLSGTSLRESL